jgi:hypothetical protein
VNVEFDYNGQRYIVPAGELVQFLHRKSATDYPQAINWTSSPIGLPDAQPINENYTARKVQAVAFEVLQALATDTQLEPMLRLQAAQTILNNFSSY